MLGLAGQIGVCWVPKNSYFSSSCFDLKKIILVPPTLAISSSLFVTDCLYMFVSMTVKQYNNLRLLLLFVYLFFFEFFHCSEPLEGAWENPIHNFNYFPLNHS